LEGGRIVVGRGMCYHFSPEWLKGAGSIEEKAGCIEIYQVADYIDWRKV